MERYALFTNDVETHSLWFNSLRDETGYKVWREAMPKILDLYDKHHVKSTFFYTGHIANLYPDVVTMAAKRGHEIACHGLSHKPEDGFDVMPFEKQKSHLLTAKSILEEISGQEVISFRAPALRVNEWTTQALIETGFKIDSSIASQRFDFGFSFGSKEKLKFIFSPRLPYRTSSKFLHKKGEDGLIEVPVSAFILPYISPSLRAFPITTRMLRRLLVLENRINNKPLVFYSHPPEFIDESDDLPEKETVNRRVSGTLEYLVRDFLKSKIKRKNLGPEALSMMEREVKFFVTNSFRFLTLKEFCLGQGLIEMS